MNLVSRIYRWMSGYDQQRLEKFCPQQTDSAVFRRRLPADQVETFRDAKGRIRHVRIGSWRVIAASGSRRIAEVRQLHGCNRLAVRIELGDDNSRKPSCTIWELYDLQGHLLAMLQSMPVPDCWLATDFQSGRVWQSNTENLVGLCA